MRSVFVSQLSARVGDRELFQFFEQQAGKVRDARLITDRISRRSKGLVVTGKLKPIHPHLTHSFFSCRLNSESDT
jgi:hypothetical protein